MMTMDEFRERYPMPWEDLVVVYDLIGPAHQNQNYFTPEASRAFFGYVDGRGGDVLELGGWQGHLAQNVWDLVPGYWDNYEVCRWAVENSVLSDLRYRPCVATAYLWDYPSGSLDGYRTFVASHVLEHLRLSEIERLAERLTVDYAYLQAPIPDVATDWAGYDGTHVYDGSWSEIEQAFEASGLRLIPSLSGGEVRSFGR
jgi:hypothetical protein